MTRNTHLGPSSDPSQDRDVILVDEDRPALVVTNPRSGRCEVQTRLATPLGLESCDRGWTSGDARLNGAAFRYVNTQLRR